MNGRYCTVEAGDFVYDCSGLVVAAWAARRVDLVRQGASWTEPMLAKPPRRDLRPPNSGDLLMFDFDRTDDDLVSHVGSTCLIRRWSTPDPAGTASRPFAPPGL
ncbi:MAG: hypothetical protein R2705_16050 [Ilumatobacteraceae bacterium]